MRTADITNDERDLILCGLFELTVARFDNDELCERCKALAGKLGGDPDALFFASFGSE